MEYKIDTYYKVKNDIENKVLAGDTLIIKSNTRHFSLTMGEYVVLIIRRKQNKEFGHEHFKNKEELDTFMEGIEIEYDLEYFINIINKKLDDAHNMLFNNYEIDKHSGMSLWLANENIIRNAHKTCIHPFKEVSQKGNLFYCNICNNWI